MITSHFQDVWNQTEKEIERTEKIAKFYHSDFVKANMPHILEIPFEQYLQRELAKTFDDYKCM
jgi:hypothetical protein